MLTKDERLKSLLASRHLCHSLLLELAKLTTAGEPGSPEIESLVVAADSALDLFGALEILLAHEASRKYERSP